MYIKQIDQNTALDLCKKGIEVKVLMADNDGDWKGMIPDTLQNVLDGCMFFREEPAIENQKLENALEAVPKSPPPSGKTAGSVGASAKRKKVDTGKGEQSMDRKDAEKVIQNLRTKPFICSDDCLLLDNGYVILRTEYFDQLRMSRKLISADSSIVSLS